MRIQKLEKQALCTITCTYKNTLTGKSDDDQMVPNVRIFIFLGIRCPKPLRGFLKASFGYAMVTDATGG